MKNILLSVTLLPFLGCALPPTYVPPPKESSSVLEFNMAKRPLSFVYFLNGNNCSETVRLNDEDNPIRNATRILVVPANRTVALTLFGGEHVGGSLYKGCSITISFKLKPDTPYRLSAGYDGSVCYAGIQDSRMPNLSVDAEIEFKEMQRTKKVARLAADPNESTCEAMPPAK